MGLITRLIGLALLLLGVYFLGRNIYFTTNVYPYWWRGIAADFSVLSLTLGIIMFFVLPSEGKTVAWIVIGLGILFVFYSSRVVLKPTTMWQFFVSTASFVAGYQLFTKGRLES